MKKCFFEIVFKTVLIFTFALASRPVYCTNSHNTQNYILIAGGAALGAGMIYITGRGCSALTYALAKRRYEPEMELLQRMVWKESVLEEELVPYILDQHAKMNQSFFYYPGVYKNYPLLKYKNDLQSYINYLWFLQLFRLGTETRSEISRFTDKLQMILRYIVTDYRFIKEQRQFDESKK